MRDGIRLIGVVTLVGTVVFGAYLVQKIEKNNLDYLQNRKIVTGDVDGDEKLDLIVMYKGKRSEVFFNRGNEYLLSHTILENERKRLRAESDQRINELESKFKVMGN